MGITHFRSTFCFGSCCGSWRSRVAAVLIAVIAAAQSGEAFAQQTLYWSGTTGTSAPLWSTLAAWSTLPGSWSQPSAVPGASNSVVFNISPLTTPQDVYLGGSQSALGLTFSSTSATTLRGGASGLPASNTLTLGTNGITTGLGAGAVAIGTGGADNVNVVLGGSQTWSVVSGGGLTVGGGVAGSAASGAAQTLTVAGFGPTTVTGVVSDGAGGGALNLTKQGLGVLRLGNVANTYSGTTTVSAGALVVSSTGSLGQGGSAIVVSSGGGLYLDGVQSPLTLSRNISIADGGPAPLGALVSIGSNAITGSITVPTSASVASTFGTLTMSGPISLNSTLFIGNTALQGGVGQYVVTGTVAGTGGITKAGNNMVLWNPANTSGWSGGLTIQGNGVPEHRSSFRILNNLVIGSNSTVTIGNAGRPEIRMDAPLLQTTGSVNANLSLSGAPSLFLDHAPGSTQTSGTLVTGNWSGAAPSSTIVTRNGYGITTGNLPAGSTVNTSAMSGPLTITGSATGAMTFGAGSLLMTGNLTTSGTLTKSGGGLATVTSTSGTGGLVDIQNGGLAITDFRTLGNISTGTINLGNAGNTGQLLIGTSAAAGSAADLTSQRQVNLSGTTGNAAIYASQSGANPVVIGTVATTGTGNKALVLGGTSTLDNRISGTIANLSTGTTSLQKTGPGTWVLSGPNTFTGTASILQGTLKLNATGTASTVLADTAAITFGADSTVNSAGGTLVFTGTSGDTTETTGSLTASAGAGRIVVANNGGASTTLRLGGIAARTAGATVDFAPGSNAFITLSSTPTLATGTILGPAYSFSGTDWATVSSGSGVVAATNYVNIDALGSLITSDANSNVRFNAAGGGGNVALNAATTLVNTLLQSTTTAATVALGSGTTLRAGGIMVGSGQAALTIGSAGGDGTLTAAASGGELVLWSHSDSALTINSVIANNTSASSLTKSGTGLLVLGGANTYTGNTVINEGTVRLSGTAATLGAITVATNTTTIRQGGTLDLSAQSVTIGSLTGAGMITNSAASPATLSIGQTAASGTTTAAGAFTGILQDGSGVLNVTKNGTGNQSLLGLSTYSGVTTINSGTLTVDVLADGGVASGIGQSDSDAANLVFGDAGTLSYSGDIRSAASGLQTFTGMHRSARTNRLFTLAGTGTATIASNAAIANALVWTNTAAIAHSGAAARTINFSGTSTGDNAFAPQITDSGSGANVTSVRKEGTGIWLVSGTNNTYSGPTTITQGSLGFLGGLPANSPVQVGVTGSAGTLLLSGTLSRAVVSSPTNGQGTITLGSATSGGAGFGAVAGKLVVAFQQSGSLQPLTWGSGGFLGSSGTLQLGAATSLDEVDFQNPINLNGATRTINLVDNDRTGGDFATLSGPISGSGNLSIIGSGVLSLTGNNTYTGSSSFNGSNIVVAVRSLGNSTTGSAASSLGAYTAGAAGALNIGGNTMLQYVGGGETSDRQISLTGNALIQADGSGPLVLEKVVNASTAAKSLTLQGSSWFPNTITSNLSDNTGALTVNMQGGRWILTGSNTFTGVGSVTNGALGFGTDAAGSMTAMTFIGGSFFAADGDRSVSVVIRPSQNATQSFIGDYSLKFTSTVANQATSNNTLNNNIAQGKFLTFDNGMTFTAAGFPTTFTMGGSGNTIINGSIVQSTANVLHVTKNGSGTLYLTGSNTYSGTTTVSAGVLSISSTNSLPGWNTAGRYTTSAAGALVVGNGVSDTEFNTIRTTGSFAANATIGFDTGSGNRTYAGTAIANPTANALGLMKIGSGTLTMNVANNYTGPTTVREGTLRLGIAGAVPTGGTLALADNGLGSGSLDLAVSATAGAVTVSGSGSSIFGAGTLTGTSFAFSNTAGTVTASTVLAGTSATLTKSNAGTAMLSGLNTYQGKTTVSGGVLEFNSIADAGTANFSALGAPTSGNAAIDFGSSTAAATLQYTGTGHASNRVLNLAGTGNVTIEAIGSGPLVLTGTNTDGGSGTRTFTLNATGTSLNQIGPIAGTGVSVNKTGSGTWRLTGNSSFNGQLKVLDGTIVVGGTVGTSGASPVGANTTDLPIIGDSAATSGTAAFLAEGVTISRGFSIASSGSSGSQIVVIGGVGTGTTTFFSGMAISVGRDITLQASNGGTAEFNSIWAGASGTSGPGPNAVFTVGSANNAGTVRFGSKLPSSITGVTVVNGTAQLYGYDNVIDLATPVTIGSALGAVTIDIDQKIAGYSQEPPYSPYYEPITQSLANLTFTGIGSQVTGTGTLRLFNSGSGATVNVTGTSTGHQISAAVTLGDNSTFNTGSASTLTVSSVISSTSGAMGLTKAGLGTLTLSAANTYSGATQVNAGTLALTGNGSLLSTGAVNVAASGATFDISGITASGVTVGSLSGSAGSVVTLGGKNLTAGDATSTTFAGVLGGSGGLTKAGTGILTLSGSNTYTGPTSITAGRLAVNGSLASAVTVAGGATLGGSGRLAGNLTGDGLIAPGNSPGILTVDGQITPTGTTSFAFEFTGTGSPVWGSASASVNDVLRLTNTDPFASGLTSTNVVNIYFDVASVANGDTFLGGFFSDRTSSQLDFMAEIGLPTYQFFVLGNGSGTATTYNGKSYYTLAQYNPSLSGATVSVVTVPTANYASGDVTNGQVTQFAIVPEPASLAMAGIGIAAAAYVLRRRRK